MLEDREMRIKSPQHAAQLLCGRDGGSFNALLTPEMEEEKQPKIAKPEH